MGCSVDDFWDRVRESQLLTPTQCERQRAALWALRQHASPPDAKMSARWLVKKGMLSPFQARELLAGRVESIILGHYAAHDQIAEGRLRGYFRGTHQPTSHPVLLRIETPAESIGGRFAPGEQGLHSWEAIVHPHVARYYASFWNSDRRVFVFEDLWGESLAEHLGDSGTLAVASACEIVSHVARALSYLHEHGIAHGDLLARHVWLSTSGQVKLLAGPWLEAPILAPTSEAGHGSSGGSRASSSATETLPGLEDPRQWDVLQAYGLLVRLLHGKTGTPKNNASAEKVMATHAERLHRRDDLPVEITQLLSHAADPTWHGRLFNAAYLADVLSPIAGTPSHPPPAPLSPNQVLFEGWLKERQEAPRSDVELEETLPVELSLENSHSAEEDKTRNRAKLLAWPAGTLAVALLCFLLVWPKLTPNTLPEQFGSAVPGQGNSRVTQTPPNRIIRNQGNPAENPPRNPQSVDDDEHSFWPSPTNGEPLSLAYVAPGAALILAWRPRDMLATEEGWRLLQALAWCGWDVPAVLKPLFGPLEEIDHLLVSLYPTETGLPEITLRVRRDDGSWPKEVPLPNENAVEARRDHSGSEEWRFHFPPREEGKLLVWGSAERINEIIQTESAPRLRRQMQQLLAATDSRRQVTLLLAPDFLSSHGREMLSGALGRIHQILESFLPAEVPAMAVSAHLDQSLFLELQFIPASHQYAEAVRQEILARLSSASGQLASQLANVEDAEPGAPLLRRFPDMVRVLSEQSRARATDQRIMLRAYLPPPAAHNLLLGSGLYLARQEGNSASRPDPGRVPDPTRSLEEILAQRMTLSFPRETLETALQQFTEVSGLQVRIKGSDLAQVGITKNHMFALDARDAPAKSVLLEILSHADAAERLVAIAASGDGESDAPGIVVTTRQAAERGQETILE